MSRRGRASVAEPRIALLLPDFALGGVQRVMLNLAMGLSERGLSVDLVVGCADGPARNLHAGTRLVVLGARRARHALLPLSRYLRQERPIALVSADPHFNVLAIWATALSGSRNRVIISVHTLLSLYLPRLALLSRTIVMPLSSIFYRRADHVVAVSPGVAEDLMQTLRLPPDLVSIVANPAVTPRVQELAREPVHHPWLQPGEPPVIVGAGRLAAAKDFPTLVRAFSLVRRETPCRLLLLGEGEDRGRIERLITELGLSSDAQLLGYIENPFPYLSRAAALVLTSTYEGFSLVLVEAMAVGTPVISTDCPWGPRDILLDGRLGPLLPVGDADGIAAAILQSLRSPTDSDLLRRRAADFSLDAAVDRYSELIHSS